MSLGKKLRIAFWAILLLVPCVLYLTDRSSRQPRGSRTGIRLVTVNADTRPFDVAESLRPLEPDLIFMQETAVSCSGAAQALGFQFHDGSDQCLLSRWPLTHLPVKWPGPWQPPQLVTTSSPGAAPLALVNVRLAIPEAVAALATLGRQWYTETQRKEQYPALRGLVEGRSPAIVCGDFNAFPFEVDLGPGFRDAWTGLRYGATFPARLPAARIDQCWTTPDLAVTGRFTLVVPSDHRALVVDLQAGAAPRSGALLPSMGSGRLAWSNRSSISTSSTRWPTGSRAMPWPASTIPRSFTRAAIGSRPWG